jgi:hypothetical protein
MRRDDDCEISVTSRGDPAAAVSISALDGTPSIIISCSDRTARNDGLSWPHCDVRSNSPVLNWPTFASDRDLTLGAHLER